MNKELLKQHIQNNLSNTVRKFQEREDIVSSFEEPIVAYVDAEDSIFDALFARGLNDHPKKIYRPGKCIIVHYTPFSEEFVRENGLCAEPTENWIKGYMESLWLAMELNRTLVGILAGQGRLTSYLNTMMEWDSSKCREEWSHKFAAAIGEIGHIGPAGSLIVNNTFGGRAGAIITDGLYADPHDKSETLETRIEALIRPQLHEGTCEDEMVNACPGGAINLSGIDRFKCQEYCRKLNKNIPMPEVCGRCFRFGIQRENR